MTIHKTLDRLGEVIHSVGANGQLLARLVEHLYGCRPRMLQIGHG